MVNLELSRGYPHERFGFIEMGSEVFKLNLKFWKKDETSIHPFLKIIEYIQTEEFTNIYDKATDEEKKQYQDKIKIIFGCVEEYQSALEYEIAQRNAEEWSKP